MKILHDLWNGNLAPSEKVEHTDPQYLHIREEQVEQNERLWQMLSTEQRELLESIQSQHDKLIWMELEDAFIKGFRLGGQFTLAIIGK